MKDIFLLIGRIEERLEEQPGWHIAEVADSVDEAKEKRLDIEIRNKYQSYKIQNIKIVRCIEVEE